MPVPNSTLKPGKRFKRPLLKRELALIVGIKALLLWLIWALFFAHPLQEHLNDQALGARMLGTTLNGHTGVST